MAGAADVLCRPALPGDAVATRQLVDDAFRPFRPEDVATFLDALRAQGCILGEWLAEDRAGPVGHVVFSRVWVEGHDAARVNAAILAPLAVRPDRQRCGIGTMLMRHALEALESSGERLFFVLGHPAYYPRIGFRADTAQKVASPWIGNPAFMARAHVVPEGRLILPPAFAQAH